MDQKAVTSRNAVKKQAEKDIPLSRLTTMRVGGKARRFLCAQNEAELIRLIKAAKNSGEPCVVIGEGSNLIPSDKGFAGLVIKNEIRTFAAQGVKAAIGSGCNLTRAISRLNTLGLAGMEKMSGIPGTVGGAIYGCAGAYGQEIKDCLVRVKIFDGEKIRLLNSEQCAFGYRESIFKKKKRWIILEAQFKLKPADPKRLVSESANVRNERGEKYRSGLRCPGSFFKNILLADLPRKIRTGLLAKIDPSRVIHGKLPAGYLLELVGAKGTRVGKIEVAKHHGNLIFNKGGGKTRDIIRLAAILKRKVRARFGIELKEEIQYL